METIEKDIGMIAFLSAIMILQFGIFAWAALRESSRRRWLIADLPCRPVRWEA